MRFNRIAYGARIKQLRINKGLTQEQLAEKMHVTGTYIVKIENSQRDRLDRAGRGAGGLLWRLFGPSFAGTRVQR